MNEHEQSGMLERHLGSTIRRARLQQGLTIADVSARAGISGGMLSRIENAQTATSLDTLARVSQALGVSMSALFRDYDMPQGNAQLVRKDEAMEVVRRGSKLGHTYHLLAYDQGPTKVFDPFLITIDHESERFPSFEHPGTEFIYMLGGKIEYRHGNSTYVLSPGDALTFRGEIPHGPENLLECPITFLSVIIYPPEESLEAREARFDDRGKGGKAAD
ncbi:helix-turn-helix domain-containing protein [Lacisediminimonas profundi]|uniref:helix-turn-helix domain-containing protein n=1 Tax=Lacisediminimonas profundi TaxID=2603856 RepID=UPI00124AE695|nr:XRE family transcriptional regulator [Lacisediminimonas profundi]